MGSELHWGRCAGIIVETEAYKECGDEACHAFFRPSTRAFIARNGAGAAYIYLNYGIHWMLNVLVKGAENGFVLIRALEPTRGVALMRDRRGVEETRALCSGPGKLTQALDITFRHHEMNLCSDQQHGFFRTKGIANYVADARIGITRAAELPWRFTLRGSPFVSRRARVEN